MKLFFFQIYIFQIYLAFKSYKSKNYDVWFRLRILGYQLLYIFGIFQSPVLSSWPSRRNWQSKLFWVTLFKLIIFCFWNHKKLGWINSFFGSLNAFNILKEKGSINLIFSRNKWNELCHSRSKKTRLTFLWNF